MIIQVPFQYELQIRLPRHRHFMPVYVEDTHPLEIREIADAIHVARTPAFEYGDRTPTDYWFWDGSFWAVCKDEGREQQPVTLQTYVAAGGRMAGAPALSGSSPPYRGQVFASENDIPAKEIRGSQRDEEIAVLDQAALQVISVDGLVLRRASEPVIHASVENLNSGGHYVYLDYEELDRAVSRRGKSLIWRLDQYDRIMRTHAAALDAEPSSRPAPEIFRPDLLTWDRERAMFWAEVDYDLKRYVERGLGEVSIEEFAAYATLRDRLRAAENRSESDLEAVREAVLHLMSFAVDPGDPWPPFSGIRKAIDEIDLARAEAMEAEHQLGSINL